MWRNVLTTFMIILCKMVKRLLLAIHQHLGLEFEYEITTYEFYNKYNGKVGFKLKGLFPDVDIVLYCNGFLMLYERCRVRHHGPTREMPLNPRWVHVSMMMLMLMRMIRHGWHRRVVTGVMVLRVMQRRVRVRCSSTMVHEWIRRDLRLRRNGRRRRRVAPP